MTTPSSNRCTIRANGRTFTANPGDVLLDAAMLNGIDIPYDCRSGACGTCQVNVLEGYAVGAEGVGARVVRACQARVLSDLSIAYDVQAVSAAIAGRIVALTDLTEDVVEVVIEPKGQLDVRPGQYVKVAFGGYPERDFSPTARLDAQRGDGLFRFHVKRLRYGRVSAALGRQILAGHRVVMRGPFGAAYFRPHQDGRLLLVAGGTGFAPIWSIACAALTEDPRRPMAVIAGARSVHGLYMAGAVELMNACPNVAAAMITQEPQSITPLIGTGHASQFLPPLDALDTIYAAGPPKLVEAVADVARRVGALLYADPFVAAETSTHDDLVERLQGHVAALSRGRFGTPAVHGRAARPWHGATR